MFDVFGSMFRGKGASQQGGDRLVLPEWARSSVVPDPSYPSRNLLDRLYKQYQVFRTCPYPGVAVPSEKLILERCKDIGVQNISLPFFRDLVNLAGGGERTSEKHQYRIIRQEISGDRRRPTKHESSLIDERKRYHEAINNFMEGINWRVIPGNCALDKAGAVLRALRKLQMAPTEGIGDRYVLPVGFDTAAGKISSMFEKTYAFDELDMELLVDPGEMMGGDGAGKRAHPGLHARCRIMERLIDSEKYRALAEIAQKLRDVPEIQGRGAAIARTDKIAPEKTVHPILSVDDIAHIVPQTWGIYDASETLFLYRAMTHQLPVSDRILQPTVRKQLLYLLVDTSESMVKPDYKPVGAALAVLLNRLRAVSKGEAELYFSPFDVRVYGESHVWCTQIARDAMNELRRNNFSGGGTKIDLALRHGVKRIREIEAKSNLVHPDLMIVTDGKDDVSLPVEEMTGIVLHVVSIGRPNQKLEALAKATGGVVIPLHF